MSQARLVIDASAVVALLADDGPAGRWVTASVTGADLAAPELMPYEAANILRRQELAGVLDPTAASLAHRDLTALPLQLCPYAPLAARAWELRRALTTYEASYVALAELLGAPLVTLDARLGRALGPRCSVLAYGGP